MGRQEVRPAIVGFVVSVVVVVLASVGGDGGPRGDEAVPEWLTGDEGTASEQEPELPDWLTDYSLHVPLIGVLYSPAYHHSQRVRRAESDALMDSLSPGVRASYEGAVFEREEAEHAAYAEWRMRRLSEERALRK
jgi:hypothetical protein